MTIAVDVLLSLILLAAGYVYTCCYFHGVKGLAFHKEAFKFTAPKIFFLAFGVLAAIILVFMFETVYALPVLSQIKLLSLVFVLLPIAAVDFREQKIPNKLLLAALAIRLFIFVAELIASTSVAVATLKNGLLGAVVVGGFFLMMLLVSKNSIGMGDIKLFAVMGLYQGLWGVINSIFFSLAVSFVFSVTLLATKKKDRKDTIAFGPCILLGTVIAIALAGM